MSDEPLFARADASAGTLAAQLGVQTAALLGQEAALAKAELRATARQATRGGIPLLAAAMLGGSAWLAGLAAAILGISAALPAWAAALIIAAALTAPAGVLAVVGGRRLARMNPRLPLTTGSVRQAMHEVLHRAQQ